MDDSLDFVGILFMIVALVLSIYQVFYSKTAKEMVLEVSEKMTSRSLAGIIQYLILIAFNTYFVHMLFDITWMLWITLVSIIGLEIILAEKRFSKSLILATGLMLLFIYSSSIPTHSDSFTDYINEKTEYQCLSLECVKVIEKITSDDLLQTEVNTFSIVEESFDWYMVFAKGALTLKDKEGNIEEVKGLNIGGLWLLSD